jgi:hypothetical protein
MLYPWQLKIVEKFARKPAFGYFLDMGLGKTPIAMASAEYVNATKVLVISINSKATEKETVKGSWLWWSSHSTLNYDLLDKNSNEDDFDINKNQVLLVNYESLFKRGSGNELNDKIKKFIESCKNHRTALILDESHRVKNLASKTTKSIKRIKTELGLKSLTLHTYLLSGSPFTQGYIDLYSQLKLLGYNSTKSEFMNRFCVRGRIPGLLEWQQPIVGYKNVQLLYKVLHTFAITIKSDDVIDLPEQIFIEHEIPTSNEFRFLTLEKVKLNYLLNYLEKKNILDAYEPHTLKNIEVNNPLYRNLSYPQTTWFAETIASLWLRARQISIGFQGNAENHEWYNKDRLKQLSEFLKDNTENYICFYNFTPEMFELYEVFDKAGYLIDVYSGELKSLHYYEEYENMTDDERVNAKKRVIIANYASGSTGKNWQQYNHTIEFSVPLYAHHAQALKRNHRIGSEKTVFYHRFYQNNWLDKGMLKALSEQTDYDTKMFESEKRIAELGVLANE